MKEGLALEDRLTLLKQLFSPEAEEETLPADLTISKTTTIDECLPIQFAGYTQVTTDTLLDLLPTLKEKSPLLAKQAKKELKKRLRSARRKHTYDTASETIKIAEALSEDEPEYAAVITATKQALLESHIRSGDVIGLIHEQFDTDSLEWNKRFLNAYAIALERWATNGFVERKEEVTGLSGFAAGYAAKSKDTEIKELSDIVLQKSFEVLEYELDENYRRLALNTFRKHADSLFLQDTDQKRKEEFSAITTWLYGGKGRKFTKQEIDTFLAPLLQESASDTPLTERLERELTAEWIQNVSGEKNSAFSKVIPTHRRHRYAALLHVQEKEENQNPYPATPGIHGHAISALISSAIKLARKSPDAEKIKTILRENLIVPSIPAEQYIAFMGDETCDTIAHYLKAEQEIRREKKKTSFSLTSLLYKTKVELGSLERPLLDYLANNASDELLQLMKTVFVESRNEPKQWNKICEYHPRFAALGAVSDETITEQIRAGEQNISELDKKKLSIDDLLTAAKANREAGKRSETLSALEEAYKKKDADKEQIISMVREIINERIADKFVGDVRKDNLTYQPERVTAIRTMSRFDRKAGTRMAREFLAEIKHEAKAIAQNESDTRGFNLVSALYEIRFYLPPGDILSTAKLLAPLTKHKSMLSISLQHTGTKAADIFAADLLLQDERHDKLDDAIKLYEKHGVPYDEKIKERTRRKLRTAITENPIRGFAALKTLVASGNVSLNIDTEEQALSGGFFADFVTKVRYSGLIDAEFIVKFQEDTPLARAAIKREERIYSKLAGKIFHTTFPTRVATHFGETGEKRYVLTVNEVLPGTDLRKLPETLFEGDGTKLDDLYLRQLFGKIHDTQDALRKLFSTNERERMRDPYEENGVFRYDKKIRSIVSGTDIVLPEGMCSSLDSILNDDAIQRNKTITFDANPSNIRILPDGNIGLFDFTQLRYTHRQDDWVRFIDYPEFLPAQHRDAVIHEAITGTPKGKLFNYAPQTRLFHAMAVYRNIVQAGYRARDAPKMAQWHAERALLSAQALHDDKLVAAASTVLEALAK